MFRTVLTVLLVFLSSTAARAEDDKGVYPAFVVELADRQLGVGRLDREQSTKERRAFCGGFFFGYSRMVRSKNIPESTLVAGMNAGVAYRSNHPESVDDVFSAFGYRRVKRTGVLRTGFETCVFVNVDSVGSTWWGEMFPGCDDSKLQWQRLPTVAISDSSRTETWDLLNSYQESKTEVLATGYLSPPGKYGHIGMWTHEFVMTQLEPLNDEQAERPVNRRSSFRGYRSYDGQPAPVDIDHEMPRRKKLNSR